MVVQAKVNLPPSLRRSLGFEDLEWDLVPIVGFAVAAAVDLMAALSSTSMALSTTMAAVLFLVLAPTSPSTRATAPRVGPPSYSISAKRVICDKLSKTKNNLSKTKKNPSKSTRMAPILKKMVK